MPLSSSEVPTLLLDCVKETLTKRLNLSEYKEHPPSGRKLTYAFGARSNDSALVSRVTLFAN